jgi:hypothetical protein
MLLEIHPINVLTFTNNTKMAANAIATEAATANLDLLKTSLDPHDYDTMPADISNKSAFSQTVDTNLSYTVPEVPGLGFETKGQNLAVPDDRGMLFWLPNFGVDNMWHMGFVQQDTLSVYPTVIPAYDASRKDAYNPTITPNSPLNAGFYDPYNLFRGISFDGELVLPYKGNDQGQYLKLAPALQTNFSKTRLYAGAVQVWSSTMGSGKFSLSGTVSTGAIQDTRDVAQKQNGGSFVAYSTVDLVQSSVTPRDGIKETNLESGVVAVVGSDIPAEFTAPDAIRVERTRGEWQPYDVSGTTDFPVQSVFDIQPNGTGFQGVGKLYISSMTWVTPWRTSMYAWPSGTVPYPTSNQPFVGTMPNTGDQSLPALNRFITDPIGEVDTLNVKWQGVCGFNLSAFQTADVGGSVQVVVLGTHVFASLNHRDRSIQYSMITEEKIASTISLGQGSPGYTETPPAVQAEANPALCSAEFDPRQYMLDFKNGKYIGTAITVSFRVVTS